MKLSEIPIWMEKYIPSITGGEYTTKEALLSDIEVHMKPWMGGVIANLNAKIELLEDLHKNELLK